MFDELLVKCPGCKALDSLAFENYELIFDRKYHQDHSGKVYHDCGTSKPCLLYSLDWRDARRHESVI